MTETTPGRKTVLILLMIVAPLGAMLASDGAAAIGNFGFLDDAPIARFSEADLKLFRSTLVDALEQNTDGSTRVWKNTETGSSGEIEVIETFVKNDIRCRRTRITNRARGATQARTDSILCKDPDGRWKVSMPEARPPARN